MRRLADQELIPLERHDVGGPEPLARELLHERRGDLRHEVLVAKAEAQLAHAESHAVAVRSRSAAHEAAVAQRLEQALYRGAVKRGAPAELEDRAARAGQLVQ